MMKPTAISSASARGRATKPSLLHCGRTVDQALRDEVLRVLPVASPADRAALEALPTPDMLIHLFNWCSRLIHPHRRLVFRSEALAASCADQDERNAVDLLCAKLAVGMDVNPHLSRRVKCGYAKRRPGGGDGENLDLLLNDWGIHHLHLSPIPEMDGFNERTDRLLFVMMRPGEAYVLMVGDHSSWTDMDLVTAAVRSWPKADLFLELKGCIPGQTMSAADVKVLRKAGVNAVINVGGAAYMSGLSLGMTGAQTATRDTLRVNTFMRLLRELERDPSPFLAQMREGVLGSGGSWPTKPRLQLLWTSGSERYGFVLREDISACQMML